MLAPGAGGEHAANCHRRRGWPVSRQLPPVSVALELVLDGQQTVEKIAQALEAIPGRLAAGRAG